MKQTDTSRSLEKENWVCCRCGKKSDSKDTWIKQSIIYDKVLIERGIKQGYAKALADVEKIIDRLNNDEWLNKNMPYGKSSEGYEDTIFQELKSSLQELGKQEKTQ